MKQDFKPTNPRCGICRKIYSPKDDDGSGLCLKCRPENCPPLLSSKKRFKQTIKMEVGKMTDDLKNEEIQAEVTQTGDNQEQTQPNDSIESKPELKIEDIITPGYYGITNAQMIPAIQKAIAENSMEKLVLLKKSHLYIFDRSIRYLKKGEREFIKNSGI